MELLKVTFTILTLPIVICEVFLIQKFNITLEFDVSREDRRLRINFYDSHNLLLQRITLDDNFDADTQINFISDEFALSGRNNHKLKITFYDKYFRFTHNLRYVRKSQDCFYLNIGHVNWYGGFEDRNQFWPIEKSTFKNYTYVLTNENVCLPPRRHWLNSRGVAIVLDTKAPLFIDQNTKENENQLCFTAALRPPYKNNEQLRDTFDFSYQVIIAKNMRIAHMEVLKLIEKPKVLLDETIIRYPTWTYYKEDINEEILGDFVSEIVENGFNHGIVEVENAWKMNISNFENVTRHIDKLGFRMTLWIHSIIDFNLFEIPRSSYIELHSPITIKLTNWEFGELLNTLTSLTYTHNFKFDVKAPQYKIYFDSMKWKQSQRSYDRAIPYCNNFYVQMIDKDNQWTYNNGLPTLITTLLQMNIAGLPFVIPTTIGGNNYSNPPDKELFIRWMEATVFMPSMQFSYFPWLYDQETVELTKKFVDLHNKWADYIMDLSEISVDTGEPINPPLWWLDSGDVVARQIENQFLLGDKVIVAPVLAQGQTERDIYLPNGNWIDGNTQKIEKGPKWLLRYPAPLAVLPYFYKD